MLATRLNPFVREGKIKKNTIVYVTKMTCTLVQDKRLIIVLELDVVGDAGHRIGSPTPLTHEPPQAATSPTLTAASSTHQLPAPAPPAVPQRVTAPAAQTRRPIYPIESLSPYHNNWAIQARVIQKGEMKTFGNRNGDGQLFGVTLMDETGEIRATAFNKVAVALYDQVQEGKVYYISGARVNLAKKKFAVVSNEYELAFERHTVIKECFDATVPRIKYDFVPLGELDKHAKESICDILAIVKEVAPMSEITSKATNRQVLKRELTLVDTSCFSVGMTLWGKQAEQFGSYDAVIAFKSVKVGDYGGRSLSFFSPSSMELNPDIPAAHALRGWYEESGTTISYQTHQSSSGSGVQPESPNSSEMKSESDYFSLRATVVFINPDSLWYAACKKNDCNKKVIEQPDGTWLCDKCNQSWPQPKYRYVMSMASSDWSAQAWLQGFNGVGELVFGKTADEMEVLKREDDMLFTSTVQEATCETYNFLCRAKSDDYNDQHRVRYGISSIQPLDYKEEAMALRDLLHSAWGQTAV
ncbi:replication factor-a protein [Mycena vitilis]|nr:replication factor-a protein [Mycena vitilis]